MNSRNRSLLISSAVAGLVCGVALTQQQVKAATEDSAASSEKVVEVQAPGSKTEADTSINDTNGLTDADANSSNSASGNEENSSTNESTEVDKNVTNSQSTKAKQQVSTKAGQGNELIDQGTWGTSKWEYTREGDDYVLHLHEGILGSPNYSIEEYAGVGVGQLNANFKNQLTKIKFDSGVIANQNSTGLFYGLTNLKSIEGLANLDTSNVTNMSQMFQDSSNLTELDLSKLNTAKVTDMYAMFYGCTNLNSLDLSSFDTSAVTDMMRMFAGCKKLTSVDVSNFNTSNVTRMTFMFDRCSSLKNINVSNFDTSNVTIMPWMFNGCHSLKNIDVSNFDTSKVTDMSEMFGSCHSLENINLSNFDTSNVTSMSSMFNGCWNLTDLDLSHFDTSKVKRMTFMFNGCSDLVSLNLSNFDTFNVTDMKYMFSGDNKLDHLVLGVNTKFSDDTDLPVNQANGKKIMWKATEGYQKGKRYSSDELMAMPGRDQVTTYDWSNEKNIIKTTTESKTVTRLINIHQPVGGVKSVEQTAVISRSVNTYDDGTTDYGEWSKSQWNACEIPTFAGYEANIKEIPAQVVTDQTTNQTIDVTYGPAKQIVTIQYIDKGNVIGTQQIRGEIGEKIKPNYEVPAGYILVCPPTIITVDKSGNQVVKINVKHEIVKGTESRTVTRTINVHQPDGSVTTTKQVVTLSRSYTEDKATGQKTYASWRTGNWARVAVPKLKGYTASSAFVPAEKVTSDSQDQLVDIYYTADK